MEFPEEFRRLLNVQLESITCEKDLMCDEIDTDAFKMMRDGRQWTSEGVPTTSCRSQVGERSRQRPSMKTSPSSPWKPIESRPHSSMIISIRKGGVSGLPGMAFE